MLTVEETGQSKSPAWLRKIKSNSLIEWFNNWPRARQHLDERHRPPTWLRAEMEGQQSNTCIVDKAAAVNDISSTDTGIFFTADIRPDNHGSETEHADFPDTSHYPPNNDIVSIERNTDTGIILYPDRVFGKATPRDSGRNTVGINIRELRKSRRRTIVCTLLGLCLILLVSIPVIVIIIMAKS